MAIRLLIPVLLCLLLPAPGWADTYYWVDENGKRHYGDRVPPAESKRERKVIDQRGFTVQTLPGEKSAEERAAQEQQSIDREEQEARTRQARAEQAKYDRVLITTYENVEAIEHVRDDRVGLLNASIQVEVEAHADNHRRLGELKDEERALLDKGKPVPDRLRERIKDTLRRLTTNEKNITELKKQRRKIESKYNKDIQRYKELTSAAN